MSIVCPRCRRQLPSSEEVPRYCSFCGQRLRDDSPAEPVLVAGADGATLAHVAASEPPPEEAAPAAVGGYRLLRLLGVGGMGRVYEAESSRTGQKVAVKLLPAQLARNPVTLERFHQEGRLASQLSHPRCVFVLEADTDAGRPFIVMELMPGDTVKDLIDRRGPLPPREAIPLILDVIDGLQEAHRFGVIHRDVKPSNCFLTTDGRVKVGDFGLSKSLQASAQLTQSGAFLGTVLYASPEQIRGEPVEYASDVYSVCATLYHMLAGRPPFQHENITAALAKIISEDAPPLRSVRPDVPRALAKVVERGLERDRNRRWQTLDELRAALAALVPSHLTYGGLTVRVTAYLLDEFFVRLFLVLPLAAVLHALTGAQAAGTVLPFVLLPLYFVLLEGPYGASLGKRMLGLRVCRCGTTDPPGVRRAAVRTLVFYLLVALTLLSASAFFESGGRGALLLAGLPFLAGLLLLVVPMRKSNDFRGIHELASGTCVMKLPGRARALALAGDKNRLLALPPLRDPVPEKVGPYRVSGAVPAANGEYVVVGEDVLLNRRVLLRLRPVHSGETPRPIGDVARPTRPRLLNHGRAALRESDYLWEAFVAPAGSALGDIVAAKGRLTWPETRPLLEQLTEELLAARKDGTLPENLSLDQVWVQRDGRLQLLEFPVTRPGDVPSRATDALDLLREVAALCLEGGVRLAGVGYQGPARAPVPLHAARFLDRLLGGPGAYADLESVADGLKETREAPAQVDAPLRLAQLSVQALALAPGLAMMFLVSGLFAVFAVIDRDQSARAARRLLLALDDPAEHRRLAEDPHTAPLLKNEAAARAALLTHAEADEAERDRLAPSLSSLERALVPLLRPADEAPPPELERRVLARAAGAGTEGPNLVERFGSWRDACALLLFWPAVWVVSAFALRGGLSHLALGVGIVDRSGRRLSRRRCALRTAFVWLPVALLLCASVWFQAHRPALVNTHTFCWLAALLLLPGYFALAVGRPERPPQDRLLGSVLVPR
jgi:uncharacterized RDD family membrane protein YckC